ncbi:MAG TPA: VC0807 family protein [Acidimicrobiales bacterium]|nr:VC0807 family protein [Acidimicrobiales bacterium]
MPDPRTAVRHAIPVVAEGVLAPLACFYLALLFAGLRGAIVAALVWSYAAAARRLIRGDRVSTVLVLDVLLLTVRTAVSFATGSSFLYFAQPLIGTVLIACVLVYTALVGRPLVQRFAEDFCPLDRELLEHPRVRQYFFRISLMWAGVLLVNSGIVAWLLVSSSLRAFVLERTATSWTLTAGAIFCSIYGFSATMRRDGCTVRWGADRLAPATSGT